MSNQHQDFKDFLAEMRYYQRDWYEQAKKDFRFANLRQWDDDILERRQQRNLPSLVIDRTRVVQEAMAGAEVLNRHQHTLMPRESSTEDIDIALAEAGREFMRWCAQRGDYEQHDSAAARDALACGFGCTNMIVDYEVPPHDGMILRKRTPIWEVRPDFLSTEPNFADGRGITRDRWVDEEEAKSLIGEEALDRIKEHVSKETEDDHAGQTAVIMDNRDYEGESDPIFYDSKRRRIRLWEFQKMERRWGTRVITADLSQPEILMAALQTGQQRLPILEQTFFGDEKNSEPQRLREQYDAFKAEVGPEVARELPRFGTIEDFPERNYYRSFHTGFDEVKEREKIETGGFTYEFITAFEDFSEEQYREFYGIIRPMRGPQTYANIFFSAAVRQWQMSPKGLWMAERGAVGEDADKFKAKLAKDDILFVEDGALRKGAERIRQYDNAPNLSGVDSLLRTSLGSIYETVGVDPYTAGSVDNLSRTSATGVQAIQDQTLKNQSQFFDSLRLYRKRTGRQLLAFIREYADPDTIRGVLSSDEERAELFIQSLQNGTVDRELEVVVEETMATQNERRENAKMLLESNLLTQMQALGVPIPPAMAEAVVIDGDTSKELKESLQHSYDLTITTLQIQKIQAQAELTMLQQAMQQAEGQGQDPMMGVIAMQQAQAAEGQQEATNGSGGPLE